MMGLALICDEGVLRRERLKDVGILTIDNPPVSAGGTAVRVALLGSLEVVSAMDLGGVVILGAGRSFVAGSDFREFGAPLADPELPTVIAAIEDCPHPVCAEIHDAALGGGYELALGCDLRVAAPGAALGLPENPDAIRVGEAHALKQGKGRSNVAEAIRLVRLAAVAPACEALRTERAAFQAQRMGEEAFALRHLFFAERAAMRIDGLGVAPTEIGRVGLVGGGTMGQGICRAVLAAGLPVVLTERDAEARDAGAAASGISGRGRRAAGGG